MSTTIKIKVKRYTFLLTPTPGGSGGGSGGSSNCIIGAGGKGLGNFETGCIASSGSISLSKSSKLGSKSSCGAPVIIFNSCSSFSLSISL